MAIASSCTAFSYSHWNAFVNDEMKIVVGCKEQLLDQSTVDVRYFILFCLIFLQSSLFSQDDPQCIIFTSELVGFTDVCESSQEFVEASTFSDVKFSFFSSNDFLLEPVAFFCFQYHAELYHLIREKFSSEGVSRVMDASPLFIETVNQLLSSIKPLTYAQKMNS